jgi:phage gp29-like protein
MPIKPNTKRAARSKAKSAGRPIGIAGEKLAVAGQLMRSAQNVAHGGAFFLPIDEIVLRKGWQTYRDMRHDDQVKATLAFKKVLVHGRSWEIVPADKSDEAKEIAKFVEFNLQRFDFTDAVKQALTALDFGFSLGEILWEAGEYEGKRAILLKGIKHRDPESIDIKQDRHGNILGFRQTHMQGITELEPKKCWHWANQSEFGNAYGISDLRAAYRSWWAKKFIMNFWNVFLERMGSPMMAMKYPHGASQELKDTLKSILTNLSTKTEVLIPEGVEIELIEATRGGTATYGDAVKTHDMAIAKGLLMIGMIGLSQEGTGRGADSQSRLQLRVLFKMGDDLSKGIGHSLDHQVLRQLVDMNFDHGGKLYPKFVWQDYGAFEGVEIADTIRTLFAAGLIDADQSDVNYIRSILGLRLRSEEDEPDEVLRPEALPPPGNANAPPPSAEQGNKRAEKGAGGKRKTDKTTKQPKE